MSQFLETGELAARLERIYYDPSLETEPDRPYPFAYSIRLENSSSVHFYIIGRKWVVVGDSGRKTILEGEGIVGQKPVIPPDSHFRYNSYLTLAESSTVSCCFFAHTEDGSHVCARLPELRITLPPRNNTQDHFPL